MYDILTSSVKNDRLISERGRRLANSRVDSRVVNFDAGRSVRYGNSANTDARATALRRGSAALLKFFTGSCRSSRHAKHPKSMKNDPSNQRGTRTTFVPWPQPRAPKTSIAITHCHTDYCDNTDSEIRPRDVAQNLSKKLPLCATFVCLLKIDFYMLSNNVAGANRDRRHGPESQREIWIRNKIRMMNTSRSKTRNGFDREGG